MIFLAAVVVVKEVAADRRNSDKKLSASSFLKSYRAHCSIPKMSFQDGSLPGIVIENISLPGAFGVSSHEVWTGIGESAFEFVMAHVSL